jgi:hypothetical protein
VPINLPNGTSIRTVTFWYPATHLGIDDWRVPLATLFDDDLRPQQRLLAKPAAGHDRDLLAAPAAGQPTRCAGGPLRLLDITASGGLAAQEAAARHDRWAATGRIGARRPGRVETALLRCGRADYMTYHRLRRVVGDALIIMASASWLYPADHHPQALLDHVRQATERLSDADPDDVLVAIAA